MNYLVFVAVAVPGLGTGLKSRTGCNGGSDDAPPAVAGADGAAVMVIAIVIGSPSVK